MAGIGFELKKIFAKKTVSSTVSGMLYSVFVTIGPMLFVICILVFIEFLSSERNNGFEAKNLYFGAVLYAFVFSLLFVSGPSMLLSRYIADKIYKEEFESLLPCVYGSSAFVMSFCGILGVLFYSVSPIYSEFKLVAYLLFAELCLVFLLMTFISAVKAYKVIGISFLVGCMISAALIYFSFNIDTGRLEFYLILSLDIGFFVILLGILFALRNYFKTSNKSYFEFLLYFSKHPKLLVINYAYTLGLYIHNFVFWLLSELSVYDYHTYLYAPSYDMASFFAMLTILPALVIFVVKMETVIYDYYKKYMYTVQNAPLEDIDEARENLKDVIYREMMSIMEIQLLISITLIVIGINALPRFGFSADIVEIFPFLAIGYYFSFTMYLIIILLLYFNSQAYAKKVAVVFLLLNTVFSVATVLAGNRTYGLGMVFAGLLAMLTGLYYLRKMLSTVDYLVFCSQQIRPEKKPTKFENLILRLCDKEVRL